MELAIETHKLSKHYPNTQAVQELDLQVPAGSIFGFLGPNGAGKTTTIRMLLGLVSPTKGSATVLGMNPREQGVDVRQQLGYVAENNNLYNYMRVSDILSFTKALKPAWDDELARRMLDLFSLPQGEEVGTLSRGMQRQLALTLALAGRPKLLLLDEPTSGLDPIKRREFLNLLLDQLVEQEQTILLSSHDLSEVERIADHVALVHHGRLLVQSPLDDLKQNVRQLIVGFAGEAEVVPDAPGVLQAKRGPNRWELIVDERFNAASLVPSTASRVEERRLSLEEIFFAYAGGHAK